MMEDKTHARKFGLRPKWTTSWIAPKEDQGGLLRSSACICHAKAIVPQGTSLEHLGMYKYDASFHCGASHVRNFELSSDIDRAAVTRDRP